MAIIDQKGIFGTRKRDVIFQRCHSHLNTPIDPLEQTLHLKYFII